MARSPSPGRSVRPAMMFTPQLLSPTKARWRKCHSAGMFVLTRCQNGTCSLSLETITIHQTRGHIAAQGSPGPIYGRGFSCPNTARVSHDDD